MGSLKQLAREYDEKFDSFRDDLKKWEETPERIEYAEFHRVQAETEFPELKKEREDRERWARAERIRGEDERHMMSKQHADEKIRLGVAKVPRLLTEQERKLDEFVERPGSIVTDMKQAHRKSIHDRLEQWSPEERALFKARQSEHVKIFHGLTEFFVDKSASDLVLFYYMNKKTEGFKKDFKPKKRVTKYKVGAYPSAEELAYCRMMPPLDYSSCPKNSLMCYFCCQTVNGIDLDGTFMPKEAYEIFAINPDENRVVCTRCREEAAKLYKDNRCFGNRCSNQKKRANRVNRNIPLDLAEFSVRTRAFLMDKLGSTRVAVKFCTPCKNALCRWIGDINRKEETIMLELMSYEGQVGWTDEEKTKLVTLINASACLDWDAISVGMNRRPNECKMQYDALNGVKAQPLLEEIDDEDPGQEELNEPSSSSSSQPTPTVGSRRSGLARNAKKTPRQPRVARSTNRRTAGAITRAQAVPKPVEDLGEEIDEMELDDNDEEASNGSVEKGSKAASIREDSPGETMDVDSPEGPDDQDVADEEEEEELVTRDIDSPVKTLLSPTILGAHKPDFPSVRLQKPSISHPAPEPLSKNDSDDDDDNDTLGVDLYEPPAKRPTPTSSSSHLIGSNNSGGNSGVHELGGRGFSPQQQQPQSAAPAVTVTTAAATAQRHVDSTSPSSSIASQLVPPTEKSESVPLAVPLVQQPVISLSGAAPSAVTQALPSPVPIAQPIPQHHLIPQRESAAAQILTPTPVRPTAASTPVVPMDSFMNNLLKQQPQQQQQQIVNQQLGGINPHFLTNMVYNLPNHQQQQVQQAQPQVQVSQQQGSITAGTPFQIQQRPELEAVTKFLAGSGLINTEMINAFASGKLPFQQFQPANPAFPFLQAHQQQKQQQQNQQQQALLQHLLLTQQAHQAQQAQQAQQVAQQYQLIQAQQAQAQHAQAQAQAQAQHAQQAQQAQAEKVKQTQKAIARPEAQMKSVQAHLQMSRSHNPTSIALPIGIHHTYAHSHTPNEPSTSATPPGYRPRAATTGGVKTVRTNVQEAELKGLREQLIKRIQIVRERLTEENMMKQEEEQIINLWHQQPVRDATDFQNILRTRQDVLKARRQAINKEVDEPVKFIEGMIIKYPDLAIFALDNNDRDLVATLTSRFVESQKKQRELEQQLAQQQAQQKAHQQQILAAHRGNIIGIRQPEYSSQPQTQQVAFVSHQNQQQQQQQALQNHHLNFQQHQNLQLHHQLQVQVQNQKRKLGSPSTIHKRMAAPSSHASSAQASPAIPTTSVPQVQSYQSLPFHIGMLPHDMSSYQQKTGTDRERFIQEQQKLLLAQQQHQQLHGGSQEKIAKRKSGIESITSMQTSAPHRHVPLAGSSSRIQGGRGVSPAALGSRVIVPATSSGRSITAGTSGHPSSSESLNKPVADLMKPSHQQLLQTKANANNSNTVSPANTNNSDEIQFVWQGPSTTKPNERRPTKRLEPRSTPLTPAGEIMVKHLAVPLLLRLTTCTKVATENEAKECLALILAEEASQPSNDKSVTNLVYARENAAANAETEVNYMDIYNEVVRLDEERQRKMQEANNDAVAKANNQVLDQWRAQNIIEHLPPHFKQFFHQNPHLIQQFVGNVTQESFQVHNNAQAQGQAFQEPNSQRQQSNKPDNYDKFQLLRPHGIARPIPTTGFAGFLPTVATTAVSSSASAPQLPQQPTSISTVLPVTKPIPSPSVAVQTAPPVPQPLPIVSGNPSSIQSIVSDGSSDDDDRSRNPSKLPSNRLPPAVGDKTASRSVIDYRATGELPVLKHKPMKYPLADQTINTISKTYSGRPCKDLVYEDLSDDE